MFDFQWNQLPSFNATLNAVSLMYLLVGYYAIKRKQEILHQRCMKRAFFFSTLFLISYLIYHYKVGSVPFPQLTHYAWVRTFYFIILIPHIILAALVLPFIIATFYFALKDLRQKHVKLAKITFPIWTFVSASGIAVYVLLYVIAPKLI